VTLDNNLQFEIYLSPQSADLGNVSTKRKFKKGDKFIWISGDRSYQRQLYNSKFNKYGLFADKYDKKEIELYFIELFSDKLFGKNNEWLFTHEEFKFKE